MGILDYRDYYECAKCKTRIHQSRVPNSITGNVECCGQNMSCPGDPIIAYATLSTILGTILLWCLTNFGFWLSLIASVLFSYIILLNLLVYIRDRGKTNR